MNRICSDLNMNNFSLQIICSEVIELKEHMKNKRQD